MSKTDSYFSQMLHNIVSEIRILNDLSEKGVQHIVRYYENDILVSDKPRRYDIFILMEYLTPLEDFIQHHAFQVYDVVKLGLDILAALQACHQALTITLPICSPPRDGGAGICPLIRCSKAASSSFAKYCSGNFGKKGFLL